MKRRNFVFNGIGVWSTPFVSSIVLPAHATTSMCSESDIIGVWRYEGQDSGGITLKENGVSDAGLGGGSWELAGTRIWITYDGNDHSILGDLLEGCTKIVGTESVVDRMTQQDITLIKASP